MIWNPAKAEIIKDDLNQHFQKQFTGVADLFIQAPGRINLIGEHTDYSQGYVLPAAIDLGIRVALRPRHDSLVVVYSADFRQTAELDIQNLDRGKAGWERYLQGVAWALDQEKYPIRGWEGVLMGDIPVGAGLSSSAALVVAFARAFSLASDLKLTPVETALIGQKAENDWVGVNVGIMDQLISAVGKQGQAVKIDCRSLEYTYIPVPEQISIMVLDTGTRRELSHSAYNTRRKECERASQLLGVPALRDAASHLLENHSGQLDPVLRKRARHVISENARVHALGKALRFCQMQAAGELINQSHTSLRDDFEVSSPELNTIVEIAQEHSACWGARMAGAGFGGCALALIDPARIQDFSQEVHQSYRIKAGIQPAIYEVKTAAGAAEF